MRRLRARAISLAEQPQRIAGSLGLTVRQQRHQLAATIQRRRQRAINLIPMHDPTTANTRPRTRRRPPGARQFTHDNAPAANSATGAPCCAQTSESS